MCRRLSLSICLLAAALTIDLRSIATDLDVRDQILISYQELLTQGLPLAAIRQQMEREQVRQSFSLSVESYYVCMLHGVCACVGRRVQTLGVLCQLCVLCSCPLSLLM